MEGELRSNLNRVMGVHECMAAERHESVFIPQVEPKPLG